MSTVDDLMNVARKLDPNDRLRLIEEIWESLPPEQWPAPSGAELAEVQRRSAEFETGRLPSSSWEQVRERLSQRINANG